MVIQEKNTTRSNFISNLNTKHRVGIFKAKNVHKIVYKDRKITSRSERTRRNVAQMKK